MSFKEKINKDQNNIGEFHILTHRINNMENIIIIIKKENNHNNNNNKGMTYQEKCILIDQELAKKEDNNKEYIFSKYNHIND